ncbi:MAG: hypothetical protein ABI175_23560 [Polyangiales bacterium]
MIRSDRRLAHALAALAVASSFGSRGALAEPSAIQKSTADALFKEGKKLMDAKDFAAACPKLAESAVLQPGGGVQLALALCHEGEGKLATAYNDYREAIAFAKRDKRKDREDIAAGKLAELEPKLSHLVLQVSDAAKAQSIALTLDGAMLTSASWGIPIPVDGGPHAVVASASGKKDQTFDVVVKAKGDKVEVAIPALADAPKADVVDTPATTTTTSAGSSTEVPPSPVEARKGGAGVGPYILGGAGIVALGIGGYFGVKAIGASSDAKSQCAGGLCDSTASLDKNDEAKSSARVANVAIGVGVLAVSGAVLWWVLSPSEAPSSDSASKGTLVGGIAPGGANVGWVMPW